MTPHVATNVLNGDEMRTEAQPRDRDPEAPGRFPIALFVVFELLCTAAFVAAAILWM